jgi:pilus assembly protein Flp/PilA
VQFFLNYFKESAMSNLIAGVKRFIKEEEGVTAIEYALIASLIAIVIIAAVATVGNVLNNVFTLVCTKINNNTAC